MNGQLIERLRNASLLTAILACSLAAPGGVALAEDEGTIEEVMVTGSRIRRDEFSSTSPVTSIGEDDIERSGLSSLGDLLQTLPLAGASLNQNSSAGTAHGSSSINLRNLGNNRTLILVDGRRWVNGAGTRGFRDFVDLNTIPLAAVERIEVLKDGASAIYGSDAIAGVVNIITRKEIEGLHIKAYGGVTSEGDGESQKYSLTLGASGDRSSALLNISHVDQDAIFVDDRKFSAVPLNALSVNSPQGRFQLGPSDTSRYTLIDGQDGSDAAHFRPYADPDDRYNTFQNTYLTGPRRLTNLFAQGRHEVTDDLTATAHLMYNKRKSDQLFSPVVPRVRGSDGMIIPADHPFNPFGVELSGSRFRIDRVLSAMGQRDNVQEVDTFRAGLGFEGTVLDDWNWDMGYTYSENDATFTSLNQINVDRLAVALGPNDRCAAAQGCVPFNIFGDQSLITSEMLDYVRVNAKDRNGTTQYDFTANITGDIWDLPAGALGFAAGYEFRKERAYDLPDGEVNSAPVNFDPGNGRATSSAPRLPTEGEYDLNEFYVEFNVPVAAGKQGIDSLELDVAARFSDYSTFGSTTNAKFGVSYRPVSNLQIRGTYSEGFRAPSIIELFAGSRQTNLPALDPCSDLGNSGASPTVVANCVAQGVPSNGSYVQNTNAVLATVGANPLLQPEESTSITMGFVYQPGWLENFDLALDWYDVELEGTITSLGTQRILDECANFGRYCNLITRETTGEILNVIDGGVNIGGTDVAGVDITARYLTPATRWGDFSYTLDAAYLDEYVLTIPNPDGTINVDPLQGRQLFRANYARWRTNATVEWLRGPWEFSWTGRYVHGTTEDSAMPNVSSVFYNDLRASYQLDRYDSRLTVGVDNVFDRDPPISLVNSNINFDIFSFNPRGMFWYAQLSTAIK